MSQHESGESAVELRRSLGFWSLTIYGVGDILGAGIYALVGKVAAVSGEWTWVSFLVAMLVAGITGLSYSELVSRHPVSGGEATYTLAAFGRPWLSFLVGWMVFWSGVLSMATVTHACANYARVLHQTGPDWVIWLLFLLLAAAINFRGIQESASANLIFTMIEASGLLIALGAGLWFLGTRDSSVTAVAAETGSSDTSLVEILRGAGLAFFAYIGFEDMVNVAEEVDQPRRHFPRAILLAVAICGTLYLLLGWVATGVMSPAELGKSSAPLLDVVRVAAPVVPPALYTMVALIAVANTGLLNSIMASRLLYGMAGHGLLPAILARVHPGRRTPHWAILTVLVTGLILVFSGSLQMLAATTSFMLLLVFSIVNLALLKLKRSDRGVPGTFVVPAAVPVLAIVACLILLSFLDRTAIVWGCGLVATGLFVAFVNQARQRL